MKTLIMILALVFAFAMVGSAAAVPSMVKSPAENVEMSKTSASSASNVSKAKKAHHKAHKKASGRKTKK